MPFQTIEQVDEPRTETPENTAPEGLLVDNRGRQTDGWTNKLIWGDNKLVLSSLKNGPLREEIESHGGLKLIYIDPPFAVDADFSIDVEVGDETFTKKRNILEEFAYRDTWGRGADSYIAMMYERLALMRDLLAEDGSIYVHCDWRVNCHLRLILDELFGAENFLNHISWKRYAAHSLSNAGYDAITDTIFLYAKRLDRVAFRRQFGSLTGDQLSKRFPHFEEETGRWYQHVALEQSSNASSRGETRIIDGREVVSDIGWRWAQDTMDARLAENPHVIHWTGGGRPRYKKYADDYAGAPLGDMWHDIGYLSSGDRERVGYPTQKPEALLRRIVQSSSEVGDLVGDFFVGSGTTAAVAEKSGRRWIVADLGKFSIHTTRKRMIAVQRQLRTDKKDYRSFELLNLGKYARQHYIGINPSLHPDDQKTQLLTKSRKYQRLILDAYGATPSAQSSVFHGRKGQTMVAVGPINFPVSRSFVEEIIAECVKKGVKFADVLAFEFEMGLFPAMLEEAARQGIHLAVKYIPPDVFERRSTDRNEVLFFDVAYVGVEVHVLHATSGKRPSIAAELTDYSVYYTQDSAAAVGAKLRIGSEKIVADGGQIIRVRKDKSGEISQEALTAHWADWIDYWAVDYDFENRREMIHVRPAEDKPFEPRWTGEYVFENEWQSFRTRGDRELELRSAPHEVTRGTRKVAVKVVDLFGNDTMKIVKVTV